MKKSSCQKLATYVWLSIKKLTCFGMGQLSYGKELIPSHCFIIFTCCSIPWPRRPCCVARLLFKEKELWYQIQQTPNYKSTKLLFVELREGVQKKHVFLGDFSQMWVGEVADSRTRSKPLKKNPNHHAFFDLNFTFRSPKSYKNPGVGG